MNLVSIGTIAGVILVALIVLGLILTRLYRRASKEVSFVRTGFGGEKVIMNGGAMVLPVLHEIIPVNMNTLLLEVRRAAQQALITRDRMRVDVMAEFYVRVKPSAESIATAAQTLGMKTMSPDELKDLVEGKFVDALRAVAAEEAAQKDAISLTVAAEAEKQAAQDRAEAVRIAAEAEAEKQRLQAKGEADAKILLAQAQEQQYKVDAEGTRAVNEAANVLSVEQVEMQVRLALLKHLPDIIRESVRPMEKIEDIKILQVNGLGGFAGGANGTEGASDGQTTQASLADQMVNSALRYRSQAPLVDGLLKELGLNGGDINGLTQGLDKSIDQS